MKKFRHKHSGMIKEFKDDYAFVYPDEWEEIPSEPQPCWWIKCVIPSCSPCDSKEWRMSDQDECDIYRGVSFMKIHFGPTPPQDDTPGKKVGLVETEESSVPAIRPELVPLPKDAAPALPYNEFDFRHLRGCPQSVFRPGDRCSCNVAMLKPERGMSGRMPGSFSCAGRDGLALGTAFVSKLEASINTTRIDLDFEPNVGELKK